MNELIPTLAIVLLAAEAGALLAHLAGLPRVVGQIGAGIVLGPGLAGLVSPSGTVEGIAQLGALAILGIAGLETNLAAMRRVGKAAFLVAMGGVIVPFVGGIGVALAAGLDTTAALFVGAILTATSVGITAATLQELGLMHTKAAITILGAAIIDDVLGLVVLGVVVSETAAGSNLLATVIPMGLTVLAVWIVLRWAPAHLGRAIEVLHLRGGGLAAMLGLVLAFAWAVQTFGGLAGITGAYVAGLSLAGSSAAPRLQMLASGFGAATAMVYTWWTEGKPNPGMMANGLLAGLVAITAPSGYVGPIAAAVIGVVAGVLVCLSVALFDKIHIDDPVGAISVHGVNGLWGVLATGIFADGTANYGGFQVTGLLYGNVGQFVAQVVGAVVAFVWAFGASYVFFKILDRFVKMRVSPEVELAGLDIPEMGIAGYIPDRVPAMA